MPIGGKGRSLSARAVTAILMVLLVAASPIAHLVLPHVSACQTSAHGGSQHAHHHGDEVAIGSVLASADDSSHEMRGQGDNCATVKGFCADCSYFCHPVFDIAGEYLIEDQGRLAVYFIPNAISKGVVPDVPPRPPQLG